MPAGGTLNGPFHNLWSPCLNSKENDPSSVNFIVPSQMKWPACESEPHYPLPYHHIPSGHTLTSMGVERKPLPNALCSYLSSSIDYTYKDYIRAMVSQGPFIMLSG